jgi:hypothetical protein
MLGVPRILGINKSTFGNPNFFLKIIILITVFKFYLYLRV